VGGEVRGNYCTLNPILENGWWAAPNRGAISNGNLTLSQNNGSAFSTFNVNDGNKWYAEVIITSYGQTSANSAIVIAAKARSTYEISYFANGNKLLNGASPTSYGSSWTTSDVIGIAVNSASNQVTFYKNGVSQGVISNTFPSGTVLVGYYAESSGTDTVDFNFGQRAFAYTAPSGFKALCTQNLPAPLVTKPNTVMDVKLYTGNGSTQTISGLGFSPDLVWIKSRSNSYNHYLVDTVRGFDGANARVLQANLTDAESSGSGIGEAFTAFTSDGFTVKDPGGWWGTNQSSSTYVGWAFDAGNTTVSNTQGSITSSVRANATAGFSVVTWTQTGNVGDTPTVGHGLGVAPSMFIVKSRSNVQSWRVYHTSLGVNQNISLDGTAAANTVTSPPAWSVSSTTFGCKNGQVVDSSYTYVAYCFAPVVGYSSAFSFTGNGSSDGPFCFLGFRPKLLLIKRSDSTGNWLLVDSVRGVYNLDGTYLYANTSDAEATQSSGWDLLSNGFKNRNTYNDSNSSGATYIGFAWAENPFQYARAR
jgi:hypothetical protein